VLGSNLAEFLQNLNNLHLHLSMGWPSMVAPGFRCEQVGSSSNRQQQGAPIPGVALQQQQQQQRLSQCL
jgi:hypothetical protein